MLTEGHVPLAMSSAGLVINFKTLTRSDNL